MGIKQEGLGKVCEGPQSWAGRSLCEGDVETSVRRRGQSIRQEWQGGREAGVSLVRVRNTEGHSPGR